MKVAVVYARPLVAVEYPTVPLTVDIVREHKHELERLLITHVWIDSNEYIVFRASIEGTDLERLFLNAHFEKIDEIYHNGIEFKSKLIDLDKKVIGIVANKLDEDFDAVEQELADRQEWHKKHYGDDA